MSDQNIKHKKLIVILPQSLILDICTCWLPWRKFTITFFLFFI